MNGSRPEALWLCLHGAAVPQEQVACAALGWSARVSLEGEDAVLVEIGGSLRLFGGINALCADIQRRFPGGVHWAVAPTPLAAHWLARGAPGSCIEALSRLPAALGALPLSVLALPDELHERLYGFGLRHVHGLLRLPRQAMARRVGQVLLDDLGRALGTLPDPRRDWKPAPRYSGRRDLAYESDAVAVLLQAVAPLFDELVALLRANGRGVRRCVVVLSHRELPPTRIRIGLLEPVYSATRLQEQLAIHLERAALPAPALVVALHASRLETLPGAARDLFAVRASGEGWTVLLERLHARLGPRASFSLCPYPDHRPEQAYRVVEHRAPSRARPTAGFPRRPIWLLPAPEPVSDPRRYRLESGPERIEYGWWDGRDVQRDYFVARDGHGAQHWVFQERQPPYQWYLHGLFG